MRFFLSIALSADTKITPGVYYKNTSIREPHQNLKTEFSLALALCT